ncbi:hypothetical protein ACYULU_08465 [Breznakiellaceae bacterium SP9]
MCFIKRMGIFLIILCLNGLKLFSNEVGENRLKTGFAKPLHYILNETEQLEFIKWFKIVLRENDFYEIEIKYNHNDASEYWIFRIATIINTGNISTGQLFDISFEGTDSIIYRDENYRGRIELDDKNNLITIEIIQKMNENNILNYRIIWENKTEYAAASYTAGTL